MKISSPPRGKQRPSSRGNPMHSLGNVLQGWRAAKGLDARQNHIDQLWRNWEMVMGAYLASMAHPLGRREHILIIGGEDQYVLQELSYAVPEILQRANAFMDSELFQKVELQLLQGRTPLNCIRSESYPLPPPPVRPERLGSLMGILDPASPVGRCYAAYVRLFTEKK